VRHRLELPVDQPDNLAALKRVQPFRNRSPDQMLATAAPWTSPWLPPGYEQNFWNAA